MENELRLCKRCGLVEVTGHYLYCEKCRAKKKEPTKATCANCGALYIKKRWNQKYCPNCHYLSPDPVNSEERKRVAVPRHRTRKIPVKKSTAPSVRQVEKRAAELGMSYGKCSLLLAQGIITL